jgi:peptide/nickel transport system permease protein
VSTDSTLSRSPNTPSEGTAEPGGSLARAVPQQRFGVLRRLARNKLAMVGLVVIVLLYLIAIFAPLIARGDPNQLTPGLRNQPPSLESWLGTDRNTRDLWARLIYGTRVSLSVGLAAVVIIMAIGITLGALAGFFGGIVDQLVMRTTDILLAVPQILLLITAAALFQPSLTTTIVVIGLTSWSGTARLVRGQFLQLKGQEYVTAARSIGAPSFRIMFNHLFPNALAVIIVQTTLWLSAAILLEASLSYLGLGVQPPQPSWGNILQDGQRDLISGAWWLTLFPGLAIFLTVLSFNLVGDGLRDAFDPRARKR